MPLATSSPRTARPALDENRPLSVESSPKLALAEPQALSPLGQAANSSRSPALGQCSIAISGQWERNALSVARLAPVPARLELRALVSRNSFILHLTKCWMCLLRSTSNQPRPIPIR